MALDLTSQAPILLRPHSAIAARPYLYTQLVLAGVFLANQVLCACHQVRESVKLLQILAILHSAIIRFCLRCLN